jgi:hypothetical protein
LMRCCEVGSDNFESKKQFGCAQSSAAIHCDQTG